MTLSTTSMLVPRHGRPRFIYVAGPISADPMAGTRAAAIAGSELMRAGLAPFVPHTSVLWQMIEPFTYEEWMAYDFAWLGKCDALLRLPGVSSGADREVQYAREALGIPVFYSVEAAVLWASGRAA